MSIRQSGCNTIPASEEISTVYFLLTQTSWPTGSCSYLLGKCQKDLCSGSIQVISLGVMSDIVIFIAVPLILLKIGIWICCCYARNKRQSHLNQQGVIVCRPATAVIQASVMRQGDRNGLTANELPSPVTSPQYGFQDDGHVSQYTDHNGLIANELATPMTSPQYGFQADGYSSQYMHCTGMNQDKHPTTNSFERDSFQPQSPIQAPPTYEEAMKSGPV